MSKKLSGAENRKRAKERKKEAHQSSSLLSSWLNETNSKDEISCSTSTTFEDGGSSADAVQDVFSTNANLGTENLQLEELPVVPTVTQDDVEGEEIEMFQPEQKYNNGTSTSLTTDPTHGESTKSIDLKDPGKWPNTISDADRCFLVSRLLNEGKIEPDLNNTLRDGRQLTKEWFTKIMPNGLKVHRTWLVYSKSNNSLYCIPCKLFSHTEHQHPHKISALAKDEGFTQWKKLSERIPEHENSLNHKQCFCAWKNLESSLSKRSGIDKELQDMIALEEAHWKGVLYAIIDVILHLAKDGSPLRGSNENLDFSDPRCGRFLNTIELVSHYHAPLKEHILRHKKGQVSYFSPLIQNEFLDIIAGKVRENIFCDIKASKYFSIMFDCTPDVSHLEQMSQVLRYVKITEQGPEVVESFIDFVKVGEKTGLGLSQEISEKIKKDGLDLKNCRGQCYDNGSNMAGKYKGVQSRILAENNLAYFVPCAAHSLNLVGANAASMSGEVQSYFGTLNCLYNFFASSTNRWEVLLKHVPLSLKLQSNTRWSTKREAVQVIYKHLGKIINALNDLRTSLTTSDETKTEAANLLKNVKQFEFIVLSCFWYKQLTRIDIVNKLLQVENITIHRSAKHISRLISELDSERANYSNAAMKEAKEMATNLGLDPHFKVVRKRRKKRMFDENAEDEAPEFSEEKKFQQQLLEIVDRILCELRERFNSIQNINHLFGFLNGASFGTMSGDDLKAKAIELASKYKEDLDKDELATEVESFKYHGLDLVPNIQTANSIDLLKFLCVNKMEDVYPNIMTALRIFLTIPVSVASNERSFSKLKIIKNYLRNLTGQQRLTNLGIISIEHQVASKLCFSEIVSTFAARKARKVKF